MVVMTPDLKEELAKHGGSMRDWYRGVYLHSNHWKHLRLLAIKTHGRKCAKCPAEKKLDVHHLNYRNIFDVVVTDLQVLCRACHKLEHCSPTTPVAPQLSRRERKRLRRLERIKTRRESSVVKYSSLINKRRSQEEVPDSVRMKIQEFMKVAPRGSAKGRRNFAIKRVLRWMDQCKFSQAIKLRVIAMKSGKQARAIRANMPPITEATRVEWDKLKNGVFLCDVIAERKFKEMNPF